MNDLGSALSAALDEPIARLDPVAGGDLNDAYAASLADGTRVFVKTSADPAAAGSFAAEAAGLRWLADAGALSIPELLALADDDEAPRFLALRWIDAGTGGFGSSAEEALGRGLAALHAAGAPTFGGPADILRVGPLALPNAPTGDWPSFYAIRRLEPLARLARDRGALPVEAPALLDRVTARLPELAGPPEPPARVHGDLWGGNVMVDREQRPWLIDPAAHGGHRELDLAMLRLFGGVGGIGSRCFAAYEEVSPLAPGAAERVALWQLVPLLLHAALFGASWGARATSVLRRYA
ncbi:MAG TPA: fructosamine kinase family protein [Thermoanaerobaculia bacterium]|nr:fructosamine kinase family protein [Thermoanaerobaculia bacterium]